MERSARSRLAGVGHCSSGEIDVLNRSDWNGSGVGDRLAGWMRVRSAIMSSLRRLPLFACTVSTFSVIFI